VGTERLTCLALLRSWRPTVSPSRLARCERLARLAGEGAGHVGLVLALAFEESHFGEDETGPVVGLCQMARSTLADVCRRRGACDHETACVTKVDEVMADENGSELVTLRRWLRGYRVGRAGPTDAEGFIGAIRATARRVERWWAGAAEGGES
jgi:hypothetical protein